MRELVIPSSWIRISAGALIVLLVSGGPALSQRAEQREPEKVHADRPGITLSTRTVDPGSLVTEAGVLVSDGTTELVVPQLDLRYGALESLEIRLRVPSVIVVDPEMEDSNVGIGDIAFGLSYGGKLSQQLAATLVPIVVVPVDEDVGAPAVEGHLSANVSLDVTKKVAIEAIALAGWVQREQMNGEADAELRVLGGGLINYHVASAATVFAQTYAEDVNNEEVQAYVGGGGLWRIVPTVLVSTTINVGVTDAASDIQFEAGGAVLF